MLKPLILAAALAVLSAAPATAAAPDPACPNPPAALPSAAAPATMPGCEATPRQAATLAPDFQDDGLLDQLREAATRIDSETPLSQRTAFDLVVPVVQGAAVIATLRDWTDSFRDTSMAFFMVMLVGLVAGATRRPGR
jgi:hypothetical protein